MKFVFADGGATKANIVNRNNDCAVIALANFTDREYKDCFDTLQSFQSEPIYRKGTHTAAIAKAYQQFGLVKVSVDSLSHFKTLEDIVSIYGDNCIVEYVSPCRHNMTIRNGDVWDTWNPINVLGQIKIDSIWLTPQDNEKRLARIQNNQKKASDARITHYAPTGKAICRVNTGKTTNWDYASVNCKNCRRKSGK